MEELEGAVVLDGLNDAIIGTTTNKDFECVLAYATDKILDVLMSRDQMTYIEAREWYDFNIDAHYGKRSPIFIESVNGVDFSSVYHDDFGGAWAV
jgi:hypothetical protein|tara:strand:+ start:287 stop:571 length:285 start_codon:yes stop_codon:yes gene_type:complete